MSVSPANVIAPKESGTSSRLAPWKQAVTALPIMETLQPRLTNSLPLWMAVTTHTKWPALIATRSNGTSLILPQADSPNTIHVLSAKNLRKLDAAAAVDYIKAFWSVAGYTQIVVMGPEVDVLKAVRSEVRTKTNIFVARTEYDPGIDTLGKIETICQIAEQWRSEMLSGLKTHLADNPIYTLPTICLSSVCRNEREVLALEKMNGGNNVAEACKELQVSPANLPKTLRERRDNLYEALRLACDAYVSTYMLRCSAMVVSEAEMGALSAIRALGTMAVKEYEHLSRALMQVSDAKPRERLAGKMIALVGPDCENDVREGFHVPKPAVVMVEKPVPQPAADVPAQPVVAAPKAPKQRLSKEERVTSIAKELTGVPTEFIAKCVEIGMLNQEKIRAKYDNIRKHAPGMRRDSEEEAAGNGTTAHVHRSLEDSISAVMFAPAIDAAIRAEGIDPHHVSLAVCKVFGYPLSPKPRKREDAAGYLANYLNGEAQRPVKAAESVFAFIDNAGLLTGNDKTISINGGTKNATGSAILRAVRDAFAG